jgi:hypothetical protein
MKKITFLILRAILVGAPIRLVFADDTVVVTGQQGTPAPPIAQPGDPTSPTAPPAAPTNPSGGFVPLEPNTPLKDAETSGNIPSLLQALYNICVGIAVVLAIVQLTRAGITYMLSDSITNKEQARHLITASILGLLLVLSPVIVFSLVNPAILKFDLNLDSLKVAPPPGSSGAPAQTPPPATPPPGH